MSTFDLELRDKSFIQVAEANKALQKPAVSLKDDKIKEIEDIEDDSNEFLEDWLEIFADDLVKFDFCQ